MALSLEMVRRAERAGQPELEELFADWEGEEVVGAFDGRARSWIFICIHSTILGPAGGGTRMKVYGSRVEALADGMRLSRAMTRKMALAGIPFGGGKAVLAVPEIPQGEERTRLLRRYAEMIHSLSGSFYTGQDLNTGDADMDTIGEVTPYVFSRSRERGGCGSTGPATALGVLHGLRASASHAFGSPDLSRRSVLVQGVGGVGRVLAERLASEGAHVLVSDLAEERARTLAERLGARVVPAEKAMRTECDVFAPCAVGGILDERSIPALRCRVVAGSANNPLGDDRDADLLRSAGILFAPDYVINAGGAIYAVASEALGWSGEQVRRKLAEIGETLTRIFEQADAEGISTVAAAERVARELLAHRAPRTRAGAVPRRDQLRHEIREGRG